MSTQHNNGWVALSERRPTWKDADKNRNVLFAGGRWPEAVARFDDYGDDRTHWQPLPPPPETEEQKRARLDEEAVKAGVDHWLSVHHSTVKDCIRIALAHARQPETRP